MLINEAGRQAKLTKKAIEYYLEQGLLRPAILENGYRDFSRADVERLRRISILRKLGLGIGDIQSVFADETGDALQRLTIQRALAIQNEQAKKAMLDRLVSGASYVETSEELEAVERGATVAQRLLSAFPGYYGRFVCLHFARFLNEPITTEEQRRAYDAIMTFLDNAPTLVIPKDLQAFLDENTRDFNPQVINGILEGAKQGISDIEGFLSDNKEVLEQYLEYKRSDEYKGSPLNRLQLLLKEFNRSSGYYELFIPAMKALSRPYAQYCRQMEIANERLLSLYPQVRLYAAQEAADDQPGL